MNGFRPVSALISESEEQSLNARSWTAVATGMSTYPSEIQPLKASLPITVATGAYTEVMLVHPLNAPLGTLVATGMTMVLSALQPLKVSATEPLVYAPSNKALVRSIEANLSHP